MSRYVEKPHGLVIGSGNVFFHRTEDGEGVLFYDAIVSVKELYFENFSLLHADIRSTAEQLLFYPVEVDDGVLGGITLKKTMYRLKDFWECWLNENCPGWGQPPLDYSDRVPTIFFAKRKHALAFANKVVEVLKGQRYL